MTQDEDRITVESTAVALDPDDLEAQPVCLMRWGPLEIYATTFDIRSTALDMLACAAYAEAMMELIAAGIPPLQVGMFVGNLLKRAGKQSFGMASTLWLVPAGSSKNKTPLVLMSRLPLPEDEIPTHGPLRGMVTAAEARGMALQWLQVAEGTDNDSLIVRALPEAWTPSGDLDKAKLFATMAKMRTEDA